MLDCPLAGCRSIAAAVDAAQQIQADAWRADYTSELIDMLNVLGLLADLGPLQDQLLTAIIDGP